MRTSATIRLLPSEFFFSRRSLLAASLSSAFLAGCRRKLAARYQGWLFIASGAERAVVVADLAQFRRTTASISVPHAPDRLFLSGGHVFVTSREGSSITEIDSAKMQVSGTIPLPGKPLSLHFLDGGQTAVVVSADPPALFLVDLTARRVTARLALPGVPAEADLSDDLMAISLPSRNSVVRVSVQPLKLESETPLGVACGPLRFRKDGRTILAGAGATKEVISLDSHTGEVLVRLPLPISPVRFCFNNDGGQMFVSGPGVDAVAIVNPYQNEVDQTVLAGKMPGAMAVSPRQNLLFVANQGSGDLTILDIDTRHAEASVHIGETPGDVLVTPDGEYALLLDQVSGNVAVVRIATVLDHKNRAKPLFTVFPTAADARSALIVPF